MTGHIKNITERSFGFIRVGTNEYFFHRDDYIDPDWEDLKANVLAGNKVKVEFDEVESRRGPRAGNVRKI